MQESQIKMQPNQDIMDQSFGVEQKTLSELKKFKSNSVGE